MQQIQKVPMFEKDMTLNKYMDKLDEYKHYLMKDRYNIILGFINEILGKEFKSLTDIKDINFDKIEYKHITEKYNEYFDKFFGASFSTDRGDLKYLIYILRKILSSSGYKLIKNKEHYTIKIK
jgi:hypothetical protein